MDCHPLPAGIRGCEVGAARRRAFRERRREYGLEYRIVRPGGEVRWIEKRSFISYRSDGTQSGWWASAFGVCVAVPLSIR